MDNFSVACFVAEKLATKQSTTKLPFTLALGLKMDRAEFFKDITKKVGNWYSVFLLATLGLAILMRIVNTELSLLISWFNLMLVIPALFTLVLVSFSRILDLHKYYYTGETKYITPSIFSLQLFPYNAMVTIATFIPPVIPASILFGLEGHKYEHTTLLSTHVLMCSLTAWFFWVVNPYIKGLVSNVSKP